MSGVSLPVTRPTGRALIVGQPAFRAGPATTLQRLGFVCTEVGEPYDAMMQLCRRPLFYSAVILSLNSLYREELQMIASIKRRFSHIEVWLSDTDGRQAALAEAVRLGADGLLAQDGLHRIAGPPVAVSEENPPIMPKPPTTPGRDSPPIPDITRPAAPKTLSQRTDSDNSTERSNDPLLTAEELRALLQETPPDHGQI